MINELFTLILKASISSSVVILLLFCLTPYLNKYFFMKWKYWIWLILAIYLCIPIDYSNIHINLSTHNMFDMPQVAIPTMSNVANRVITTLDTSPLPVSEGFVSEGTIPPQIVPAVTYPSLLTIFSWMWLSIVIILLLIHCISYFIYRKKLLKNMIPTVNTEYSIIYENLLNWFKVQKNLPLVTWSGASSPMIIGFLRPYLVLPNEAYSNEEIYFILKHELLHYKRHDIYGKLLLTITKTIHWFNPVVSLMCKEAVIDMELSCDEAVVNTETYDTKKAYAETLFSSLGKQNISTFSRGKASSPLSTQFYGGAKIMKKRFENLLTKTKKRNGLILILATVLFIVGCQTTSITKPDMYITRAKLSEEEGDIARLFGPSCSWFVFDFVTDESLQSFQLRLYKLIDGKWHVAADTTGGFTGTKSRMVLKYDFLNNEYLAYELQSEDYSYGGAHGSPEDNTSSPPSSLQAHTQVLEENEFTAITYEEEIPLFIQFINSKSDSPLPELETFFTPEKFKEMECDEIYAVTSIFSAASPEELAKKSNDAYLYETNSDSTTETSESEESDTSYLAETAMKQKPVIEDALITLNKFVIAYFAEDVDDLETHLADSYSFTIDTYPYGETFADISELTFDKVSCRIKGEGNEIPVFDFLGFSNSIETEYNNLLIDGVGVPIPNYELIDGYTFIFSIPLKATPYKGIDLDYREYLTVELLLENSEWKIQSYGLEL